MVNLKAFLFHLKARACLDPLFGFYLSVSVQVRTQIPVSAYPASGILLQQYSHQYPHRMFLPFCPGVFGSSVAVQPSFVADAYGVCVESLGMCPGPFHRSGSDDLPVLAYVEVIARSFESPSSVTLLQVMLREAAVFLVAEQ